MIRKRALPPECVPLQAAGIKNTHREVGRICMQGLQQGTAVRSEDLSIGGNDQFKQTRSEWIARAGTRLSCRHEEGSPQSPSPDFVFGLKSQFFIQRSSLRRGVKLDGRDFQTVQAFDCSLKKPASNTTSAILRVNQYHANPGESILERDRRGRSVHLPIHFCDKASFQAGLKKSFPIGPCLIPTGNLLEPHSRGDVRFRHRAQTYGGRIHGGDCNPIRTIFGGILASLEFARLPANPEDDTSIVRVQSHAAVDAAEKTVTTSNAAPENLHPRHRGAR
jgi:hypothetical protein